MSSHELHREPGVRVDREHAVPTGIDGGRSGSMNVVDPELSEFTFSSGA